MTLDGEFVAPPRQPVGSRVMIWAIIVTALAGTLAIAAFALWLLLMILPIIIGAGAIAYAIYRVQLWLAGGSVRGQRNIWRP